MAKQKKNLEQPAFKARLIGTARQLCEMFGATHEELAGFFTVDMKTLDKWIRDHPEFEREIWRGSLMADGTIAERLYRRCVGYTRRIRKAFFPEGATEPIYAEVDEHLPPDVEACKFWLCNRQPEHWRNVLERGELPVTN